MFEKTKVATATTLLFAGLLPACGAWAQGDDNAAEVEKIEAVVVTGSRLVRPNLTSSTPVMAIGRETLTNLGSENFADIATQLPQFAPSFGSSRTQSTFSGVASSGLNNANLRNLGAGRSLVLVNGRRVPGGNSTGTAVDFNALPTANIERVDIITGGASAIYGADAMAGVINIITRRNVQGLELGVSYGESGKGDNRHPSASLMMGGKFGERGRGLLAMQLDNQGRVSCADRAFCSDDFFWADPANPIFGPGARSGVGAAGRFFIGSGSYTRRNGSFTDAAGKLIPFSTALDGYNRNAQRDLAIPTRRMMLAGDAEYRVGERTTAFAEINFADTGVYSNFEGHPFQSSSNLYGGLEPSIPLDNPFIPAALRAEMVKQGATQMTWWQRFSSETLGGNRGAKSSRTMVRTVVGLRGEFDSLLGLGEGWRWEASSTFGRTREELGTQGSVGLAQLYNGLRVEETAPGSGVYRCKDAAARAQGCVPVNPFAPYTPAMSSYLSVNTASHGVGTLNDTVAHLSGSLLTLPAGEVRTVVGAEYRSITGFLDHDTQINQGTVTGNQIGDTDYVKVPTRELFAELLVPVLADKPFAHSLNLEAAFRNSHSRDKSYNTWKFGGDWEPTEGLRLRAMRARAMRTPTPGELSGIGQTFGVVNDPCTAARRNANPTRAANCLADGVPADYNPAQSIEQSVEGLSGGNAKLNPEKGSTLTYGFVFQPPAIKGLSLSVDRFQIDIDDMINSVSRQVAVNLCYDTANRMLCSARTRGTHPLLPGATYVLKSVNQELQNIASLKVNGFDVEARYAFKTAALGDFELSTVATIYDKATLLPLVGNPAVDLLGQAGGSTADQGFIRFTANANLGWKWGSIKANWNLRHIGRADMAVGTTEAGFPRIGAHTYHNLRASYALDKSKEVYVGVTNLMDKKPPLFASGASGTQALDTIPGYYDVFGRSFFAGATLKF